MGLSIIVQYKTFTYNFQHVRGVYPPVFVEDQAHVLSTVLLLHVDQSEDPGPFRVLQAQIFLRHDLAVLVPHDVRLGLAGGLAPQPDDAPHRPCQASLFHSLGLTEHRWSYQT